MVSVSSSVWEGGVQPVLEELAFFQKVPFHGPGTLTDPAVLAQAVTMA